VDTVKKFDVYFNGKITYFADNPDKARDFAKKDLSILHPKFNTELNIVTETSDNFNDDYGWDDLDDEL